MNKLFYKKVEQVINYQVTTFYAVNNGYVLLIRKNSVNHHQHETVVYPGTLQANNLIEITEREFMAEFWELAGKIHHVVQLKPRE